MRSFWGSFPALGFFCAGRDKLRAGREKLSWFPAGRGKRSAVSALLSQTVFQSQLRACKVPTSVHEHAGAPLHSLLDLSDIHISSRQFPALQTLQAGSWPHFPWREKPLWCCSSLKSGSHCPSRAGTGAGGEGKHQLSSQHPADGSGVPSPASTTSSFLTFLKASTKQSCC